MGSLFPFSLDWKDYLPFGLNGSNAPGQADDADVRDTFRLRNGTAVTLRAVRADDADRIQSLVHDLSMESRYHRFFYPLHELPPDMLARFTLNDPTGAMTVLAVIRSGDSEVAIGMAQYVADPYPLRGEFAVVVSDEWQRSGLGTRLIQTLICVARAAGITQLEGDVLAENEAMVRLMVSMGFALDTHEDGAYLWKASKVLSTPEWGCSSLADIAARARHREVRMELTGPKQQTPSRTASPRSGQPCSHCFR
ncbi:GNAT family N-acetyltransferase [Noviherbaspirillum saxi]|uniref:GNAT family N-acetyltransferase n=1 Tax=Noviherbaspirillum saxi TaxID=2320863 RepID=A0A3A3FVW4_9BURK|nr:GNAT family N-acetyltransferase [Noviherbaspirillum saxi]RJF99464.1 GNAT family N-acetyltransferase [Noviherbaspirillum saxi]